MIKLIIFDIDNTLTDFIKMKDVSIDASIDAMIDAGPLMRWQATLLEPGLQRILDTHQKS